MIVGGLLRLRAQHSSHDLVGEACVGWVADFRGCGCGRGGLLDGCESGESVRRWREVRRGLNERRFELTVAAGRLYPDVPRVGSTVLLGRPEWIASRPVEL